MPVGWERWADFGANQTERNALRGECVKIFSFLLEKAGPANYLSWSETVHENARLVKNVDH